MLVDLWVDEFFPFVIAENNFAIGFRDNVIGIKRDFSSSPWSIENVLGESVASGVTTQVFDEIEPSLHRSAEVRGAFDEIALIEVVGLYSAHQELV